MAYLHQLALTFTRKATEEMKMRILKILKELSLPLENEQGAKFRQDFCREPESTGITELEIRRRAVALHSAILHDYGRFSVYTIDAFFQRIVRSFIWEAGLPNAYTVELDSQRILQEAIDQVVDEVSIHPLNRKWICDILSERIQEGKRWNVQEAFAEVGKQLFDEKFRSFGSSFINQLCDKEFLASYMQELRSWEALFQKQMKQYATEVLTFLDGVQLSTTDFKGKTRSFMRYFDKMTEGVYTPPESIRKAINDPTSWTTKNDPKAPQIESIYHPLNNLINECIKYYDAQAPTWFAIRLVKQLLPQMGLTADILRHANNLLKDDNAVHLSQTLLLLSALTSQSDAPFILERMGCRYSDFLLDEFQDTSVLQWQTMLPLVHNGLAQGGDSMVVGDVKQSIYRWRNSDWRILGGGIHNYLAQYHPKDEYLKTNWRSREVLVDTVGNLFEKLIESVYQNFLSSLPQTTSPDEAMRLQAIPQEIVRAYADVRMQIAPTKKDSGGYVAVYSVAPTQEQSAKEQILERLPFIIMELQNRGYSASDICILVRKNEEGQQVASTLMAFKETPQAEGTCFDVVSPDALFLSRSPEVQLVVAIFKKLINQQDAMNNLLIKQLCTQLNTNCPDTFWEGSMQHKALPEVFEEIIRIFDWTERQTCFPYLQELHNQILSFSKNQASDLFSFVQWWARHGEKITLKLERTGAAIEILTIHKSKGLEFPVVIIPFCDWGLDYLPVQAPILWVQPTEAPLNRLPYVPVRYGSEMAQSLFVYDYFYEKMQYRVDQLNVFYVATTRAEDELYLFLPQSVRSSYNMATILKEELSKDDPASDTTDCSWFFGEPVIGINETPKTIPEVDDSYVLHRYPSASSSLRLHTQLADESPLAENISPRKRGIILHQLLSRIHTHDDIEAAIVEAIELGWLTPDAEEQLYWSRILRNAISQPKAADWFDGSWTVRNEASILLPTANGQTIRPDRVMEKEGRMVVIDYKFGDPNPAHHRQMDTYTNVLKQMGYNQVEGHVWYIPNI